jgi:hypothetical protein
MGELGNVFIYFFFAVGMDCFTSYIKTKLKTTIISGLFISYVQERSSMGRYHIATTNTIKPELLTAMLETMKTVTTHFGRIVPWYKVSL